MNADQTIIPGSETLIPSFLNELFNELACFIIRTGNKTGH